LEYSNGVTLKLRPKFFNRQNVPPVILAEEMLHRGNVQHPRLNDAVGQENHLDFFATFCIKAKSRSESTSCEK
jgi:hypothetical protein